MPQVVMVKTGHSFPRRGMRSYQVRRGIGDGSATGSIFGGFAPLVDPVTGNFSLSALENAAYAAETGALSADQLAQILVQDKAANAVATTSPVTGEVNQTLLDQANAEATAGIASASNVSGVNTGSWLANLSDQLQGTYSGPLGIPGLTPPLGTPVSGSSPAGGIDWTSILETLAIGAALIFGGVYVFKHFS
jgi:hypothetical protein